MVIEHARYKRADYKIVRFKGLMNSWRHMHPAGNRLKVVNRKCPRIEETIPADGIKWMSSIYISIQHSLFLDHELELSLFIMRLQVCRFPEIPFTERCVLFQLSVRIAVPLRRFDGAERFYDKQPVFICIKADLVNDASRNYEVVAIGKSQFPIECL